MQITDVIQLGVRLFLPVFVEVKKAISCRIRASNRLVRILTLKRVIATVNRPPLTPVQHNPLRGKLLLHGKQDRTTCNPNQPLHGSALYDSELTHL